MKLRKTIKEKIKKPEYHPEKYTEKFIVAKFIFVLIQILLLCFSFSVMFTIATKKIISSLSVMFSCNKVFELSVLKIFITSFIIIFLFILLLTLILYLLNLLFDIKLTFKQALSIVVSSYIYFTLGSILASIFFLIGWGYIGYIILIVIFFITQFNVYKTYYSVVESHGKRFCLIVSIIYIITSIITFIFLNISLFNYIKNLYINFC